MTAHQVTENEMLNSIINLLKDSGLPYKDISLEKSLMFSYLDDHGNIIGSGGLEFYGPYALLRSVAVRKDLQGKAIGKRIVNDLFEKAKEKNARAIYLLTETANKYFSRLQFHDVDRNNVPQEIRSSSEFSNVCPTSSACMMKLIL
jgi:amino-acid N-acetyltransferase